MLTFILSHAKYESFLYVPLNVENTEKKNFIGTKNRIRMINIDLIDLDTKGNTQIWLENFVYYIARAYKKEIN